MTTQAKVTTAKTRAKPASASADTRQKVEAGAFNLGFNASRAEVSMAQAMMADCAFFKVHAIAKRVPEWLERAYKIGALMGRLNIPDTIEGRMRAATLLERGAKRTKEESDAILAINNRYSRRLIAAELYGKDDRGAERGIAKPKPKAKGKGKVDAPAAPAAPAKTAHPIVVNEVEWLAFIKTQNAALRATQRKNAQSATARIRAYIKAVGEAEKILNGAK